MSNETIDREKEKKELEVVKNTLDKLNKELLEGKLSRQEYTNKLIDSLTSIDDSEKDNDTLSLTLNQLLMSIENGLKSLNKSEQEINQMLINLYSSTLFLAEESLDNPDSNEQATQKLEQLIKSLQTNFNVSLERLEDIISILLQKDVETNHIFKINEIIFMKNSSTPKPEYYVHDSQENKDIYLTEANKEQFLKVFLINVAKKLD